MNRRDFLIDKLAERLGIRRKRGESREHWHGRLAAALTAEGADLPQTVERIRGQKDPEWLRLAKNADRGHQDCITTWIVHLDGRSSATKELVRLGLAHLSNTGPYAKSAPAPWIGVANDDVGRALVAALPASARAYLTGRGS